LAHGTKTWDVSPLLPCATSPTISGQTAASGQARCFQGGSQGYGDFIEGGWTAGCSLQQPSYDEKLGGGGRHRQLRQLVAGNEVEDEDEWWTTEKLAEDGTGQEKDGGRWLMVIRVERGGGSVNGGSRRRWSMTRATTGF
jgi:hypothetical protein